MKIFHLFLLSLCLTLSFSSTGFAKQRLSDLSGVYESRGCSVSVHCSDEYSECSFSVAPVYYGRIYPEKGYGDSHSFFGKVDRLRTTKRYVTISKALDDQSPVFRGCRTHWDGEIERDGTNVIGVMGLERKFCGGNMLDSIRKSCRNLVRLK